MNISDRQRDDALNGFLNRTQYNGKKGKLSEQDIKTAKALKEFRDEEMKKQKKKREEKLK